VSKCVFCFCEFSIFVLDLFLHKLHYAINLGQYKTLKGCIIISCVIIPIVNIRIFNVFDQMITCGLIFHLFLFLCVGIPY